MNIKHLNESFKNLYEDNVEDVKYAVDGDLRTALTDAAISLESSGNGNIKAYEDAFQRVLEEFYPDKSWWEVTTCNIFWSLFEGRNPKLTIDDIMNNLIVNETPVEESLEDDDDIDDMYHDYSEDELRKMDAFDNLNENVIKIGSNVEHIDDNPKTPGVVIDIIDDIAMVAVNGDYDDVVEVPINKLQLTEYINENVIKVTRDTKGCLEEKLNECLSRLNEASISPEDQRDSDLIRSMLAKMKNRANAKFTPEEKAVMKKYGIERDNGWRTLTVGPNKVNLDRDVDREAGRTFSWQKPTANNGNADKINYADRARKIPERDKNQFNGVGYHYYRNDDFNAHGGSRTNQTLKQRERDMQNTNPRMDQMKRALSDRKYHKDIMDNADAAFERDSALAKDSYDKQMAYITRRRDDAKTGYNKQSFDKYQAQIDKLLKRDKTNSGE